LTDAPRMADFAQWACAALGDSFLTLYRENQDGIITESLETSPVARAVVALMDQQTLWEGSTGELLHELAGFATGADSRGLAWPKTDKALVNRLARLKPHLRHIGIEVERDRSSVKRWIRLRRDGAGKQASHASQASSGPDGGRAYDAYDASIPTQTDAKDRQKEVLDL